MTDRLILACVRCPSRRRVPLQGDGPEIEVALLCWKCQLEQLGPADRRRGGDRRRHTTIGYELIAPERRSGHDRRSTAR